MSIDGLQYYSKCVIIDFMPLWTNTVIRQISQKINTTRRTLFAPGVDTPADGGANFWVRHRAKRVSNYDQNVQVSGLVNRREPRRNTPKYSQHSAGVSKGHPQGQKMHADASGGGKCGRRPRGGGRDTVTETWSHSRSRMMKNAILRQNRL